MTSQYSRKAKKDRKSATPPTVHIKTGFSALQKTIALIGSILSIIVASITINNALNNKNKVEPTNEPSSYLKDTTTTNTDNQWFNQTPSSSQEFPAASFDTSTTTSQDELGSQDSTTPANDSSSLTPEASSEASTSQLEAPASQATDN
ncbi:DUF6556 family protein [Streptococcus cuniculipharyngis]|uniref:DUF6556 family protein n=1 Tax=Streptococcus cuniculipharyngis TaxID=1562651 RepID=UPI001FE59809|nr:DUF6556 family protein [Streptococcus cuniculipharyngis]